MNFFTKLFSKNKPLVYVACPYSYPDKTIPKKSMDRILLHRFKVANKVSAELMRKHNLTVFSPISMSHPIAIEHDLPGNWEYWASFDEEFLSCCKKMYVICIDGWKESVGVTAEIAICKKFGVPIEYIEKTSELLEGIDVNFDYIKKNEKRRLSRKRKRFVNGLDVIVNDIKDKITKNMDLQVLSEIKSASDFIDKSNGLTPTKKKVKSRSKKL